MAFNYSSSFNVPRQSSTHGSDCSSNASLSPTSASHPKSANPGTCNMNIHATSSSGISSSCVQMSKTAGQRYTQCMFCKTNGETIQVYGSHSLKDDYGRISCPILFRYVCPNCNATGFQAHTIKYCPLTNRSDVAVVPNVPCIKVGVNSSLSRPSAGGMRPILGQQQPCSSPNPQLAHSNPSFSTSSTNGFRHELNRSSANRSFRLEHNSAWTSVITHPNAQIWRRQ